MEEKIRSSFAKQGFMQTLGARLACVKEGEVRIECDRTGGLIQQHGYLHAGVLASLADSACGYAALTMMPAEAEVVSVEFKINLLRPATSEKVVATGRVFKAGRTLTVCDGLVTDASGETVFAKMTATMMRVDP